MVNKVMLIGNLGKDPESKFTTGGLQIAKFSLATTENVKKGDSWEPKTEWHNIILFNKQAEIAEKYYKKGNTIYVEGKISTSSWQDKETQETKYKTEIIGNIVRNLTKRDSSEQSAPKQEAPQQTQEPKDDLPF